MSRSADEFSTLDTTTKGKLNTIAKQKKEIRKRFKNFKGYCIGLPGAGKQAARHRDEYCNYGFPENRQIMLDYSRNVTKNQIYHLKKINYAGRVMTGELSETLDRMWAKGYHFDGIDYDDVGHLSQKHLDLICKASAHDVKFIVLVLTNRCNKLSDLLLDWKNKLGLRKRWTKKHLTWSEPIGDIQEGAVTHVANKFGYDVVSTRYKGKSQMISLLLLKR